MDGALSAFATGHRGAGHVLRTCKYRDAGQGSTQVIGLLALWVWAEGGVLLEGDKQPQKERWCWAPPCQLDSLLMPPLVGVLACACMVGREAGRARGYQNAEASLC